MRTALRPMYYYVMALPPSSVALRLGCCRSCLQRESTISTLLLTDYYYRPSTVARSIRSTKRATSSNTPFQTISQDPRSTKKKSPPPKPPEPILPRGAYSSSPRRPTQVRTAQPLSVWSTIKSIFGIPPAVARNDSSSSRSPSADSASSSLKPISAALRDNPYRARKEWPPDFTTLHPKHQFRYEKTFRRRLKLKYQRPGWIKGTKVVQYVLIVGVAIYWIFFLEVKDDWPVLQGDQEEGVGKNGDGDNDNVEGKDGKNMGTIYEAVSWRPRNVFWCFIAAPSIVWPSVPVLKSFFFFSAFHELSICLRIPLSMTKSLR